MRRVYFFLFSFLAFAKITVAQSYTWVGAPIGDDYQVAANWSPARTTFSANDVLIFNATTAINVTHVPNETIGGIIIASGTSSVSFETDNPANILTINGTSPLVYTSNGSILASNFLTIKLNNPAAFTMNLGTFGIMPGTGGKIIINSALTLDGGTLDIDVAGTGGAAIFGSVTYISGVFNCNNNNALTWSSGSNYFHACNGSFISSIPAAIWQMGSTCNVTGMEAGAIAPGGLTGVDFSNFVWECTAQASDVDLGFSATTFNVLGSLTVKNTNNKNLVFAGAGGATISAATYGQTAGNVILQSSSGTTILSVKGTFSQTGGSLDGVAGALAGTAILDLKGNVIKSATWLCSGSNVGAQTNIQFSGNILQTLNISGSWNDPIAGRFNIINNNTDIVNGINLTGTLKVINSTNTLPASFTMNGIISGGAVSYTGPGTGGLTLIYSGFFFQNASTIEFPVSNGPTNLTINNTLGVTFPTSFSRTISGTLSMVIGNLAIGIGNTLSLTNATLANQLAYTGGFITTGTLGRYFPTSGLPTAPGLNSRFPFGTGVNDRSLNIFFSSSTLSGGTAGMIYVSHTPVVGITAISLTDNNPVPLTLDKRTNTNWSIGTSGFNLGSTSASLTAVGANIGSVDDFTYLRLSDGITPDFGALITTGGTNAIPVVGKSGLLQTDINKTLYIGSDSHNPLIIITFTWTGLGGNTDWTNPGNWMGGVGYPSASTEIAIVNNNLAPQMPKINTGVSINVYQLTVGSGTSLTLAPSSGINVFDNIPDFNGSAFFASTSTFGYFSSNSPQTVLDLPYGNLSLSGTGAKTLGPQVTVTGDYTISGNPPVIGTGTFTYAGSGAQRIGEAKYYNLTVTGNRGNQQITLGNGVVANTIDISNVFDVSSLSNYTVRNDWNTINFSSALSQPIPGFAYNIITNSGNGPRVLDNLGSASASHEISCIIFSRGTTVVSYTVTNSKVRFIVSGDNDVKYFVWGYNFHDIEFSGNLKNKKLDFFSGPLLIAGKLAVSLTNYQQVANNSTYFVFNGTGDQTITAFKTNTTTNTPAFKYPNIIVHGGNRNVTLGGGGTDTINITGSLQVPRTYTHTTIPSSYGWYTTISPFSASKGFIVAGSSVNFSIGSDVIPLLIPSSAGTYNYNNVIVSGGIRLIDTNNVVIGGNLYVSGGDVNAVTLTSPASLVIGDGASNRVINVLGDVTVAGTSSIPQVTGQIDLNPGTSGNTTLNISKSLIITGKGQIKSTGATNGSVLFKGILPHTYKNTSSYKNDFVNFIVGDGITNSKLTLLSSLDLNRSTTPVNAGTLTVLSNDSLDCGTFNVLSNLNNGAAGNARFNLQAGATLITANTGGIEGTATSGADGSIINDATIVKAYDPMASYVFNASSSCNTSFPSATTPFPMANLTVGNDVNTATFSLNKSIDVSNALTLKSAATLAVGDNNYLNLKSTATTTARIAPVPDNANITYGTGRFVIERYYPARRAWRLITAPITADAGRSIFNSWQLGGVTTFSPCGTGTFITGPGANPATNGLDVSVQSNSSLKLYNGTSFINLANSKNQLLSGTAGIAGTPDNIGMFLFVRGDRSTQQDLFNVANSNTTTLRDTGMVQIKGQTFQLNLPVNGFELVGNPYASPVDFNLIDKSNSVYPHRFYVWDPTINQVGAYVTMEDIATPGIFKPTAPYGGSSQNNYVQSSQAFFVQKASSAPGTMIFAEMNKSSQNNLGIFREASQPALFSSNLYLQEADTAILADGNLVVFDNAYSAAVDIDDALKFGNTNESLGLLRDAKTLAVERRPAISVTDTLFLKLTKTTQRNYRFQFVPTNMDPSLTGYLEDNYTGTKTIISISSASTINFNVNGDAASAASDRFKIVFKVSAAASPLPVTYKSIKAYQQGKDIAVEWTVENEINISRYELEKSIDGINFSKINSTPATGANRSRTTYNFIDKNAIQGNNFYRILSYNQTGSFEYSRVVVVRMGKVTAGISIYPNPITGNTIGLAFNNIEQGIYNVRLSNALGQTLMTKKLNHIAGSSIETLTPDSKMSTGIYQLEVISPNKQLRTIKVIVQ